MTRQIKLRAWSKTGKVMHPIWKKTDDENGEYIIMEWTGLYDKKRKEIYEGDIVCLVEDIVVDVIGGFERKEPEGDIGKVAWQYGCFEFVGENHMGNISAYDSAYLEIIGNIYENPELLSDIA